MQELYSKIKDVIDEVDEKSAITLKDIVENFFEGEDKHKIAKLLKKMRIEGEVRFEKRKSNIKDKRSFLVSGKVSVREQILECFYYWKEE